MFLKKIKVTRFTVCGNSNRRRLSTAIGTIMFCLLAVLLFISCPLEDEDFIDTGFIPIGEWESIQTDGDRYYISADFLDYYMAEMEWDGDIYPETILKGAIERGVDFSRSAGVIIIKITEASVLTVGKYTGVYYRDYKGSTIKLATGIGPAPAYAPLETNELSEALSLFTANKVKSHVMFWGDGHSKNK